MLETPLYFILKWLHILTLLIYTRKYLKAWEWKYEKEQGTKFVEILLFRQEAGDLRNGAKQSVSHINICTPESFNTNISYQFLCYKITFENSQYKNTISGDFVLRYRVKPLYKNKYDSDLELRILTISIKG